jgi:poly(A) polymerase
VEVGVAMAREICRRLHFSNDDTEQIEALVANHMRFMDAEKMKSSTLKRFLRLPRFEEHLELHRMDCDASHGGLRCYEYVAEQLRSTPPEEIRPEPLLNGRDLIEMGYKPGPKFSEILSAVEEAQLEGRLRTREEAVEWVEHAFRRA